MFQVSVIEDKLREKLVTEFQHMRNQATGTLALFLDYITYGYMIDNIVLLITGTLHQRPISELVGKCHPLGSFEQMEAIHIASNPAELYNAVLVDTPLAPFFESCINEQVDSCSYDVLKSLYSRVRKKQQFQNHYTMLGTIINHLPYYE